jgi:hypothetical protein
MNRRPLLLAAALSALAVTAVSAQQVAQPRQGAAGSWRLIGTVQANYAADHDSIVVQGPYDNFRRLKIKVTDAPLNLQRMQVSYDNGGTEKIDVRQQIARGGESRVIDLPGGSRSLRRIDFWYDTRGSGQGRAKLSVFGMK